LDSVTIITIREIKRMKANRDKGFRVFDIVMSIVIAITTITIRFYKEKFVQRFSPNVDISYNPLHH